MYARERAPNFHPSQTPTPAPLTPLAHPEGGTASGRGFALAVGGCAHSRVRSCSRVPLCFRFAPSLRSKWWGAGLRPSPLIIYRLRAVLRAPDGRGALAPSASWRVPLHGASAISGDASTPLRLARPAPPCLRAPKPTGSKHRPRSSLRCQAALSQVCGTADKLGLKPPFPSNIHR